MEPIRELTGDKGADDAANMKMVQTIFRSGLESIRRSHRTCCTAIATKVVLSDQPRAEEETL